MPVVLTPTGTDGTGVPGLLARHTWRGLITMNARSTFPRIDLDSINGLISLPELEDLREQATGRSGEVPRRSMRRGKTITYNGRVRARSEDDLIDTASQFVAACDTGPGQPEGQMVIDTHPSYEGEEVHRFFYARVLSLDIDDIPADPNQASLGHERSFVLGLRLSDPRFYDTGLVVANSAAGGSVTGTTTPFTPPITVIATAAQIQASLTNVGNAPTDPVVRINGGSSASLSGFLLYNATTGKVLVFRSAFALGAGHWMEINFKTRQIYSDNGADLRSQLDLVNSTWWDAGEVGLAAGANNIQLWTTAPTGAPALPAGSSFSVAYYPAWLA